MCFSKCPKAYYSWTGSRFNNKTSHQIRSRISHDFQWCSPNLSPDPTLHPPDSLIANRVAADVKISDGPVDAKGIGQRCTRWLVAKQQQKAFHLHWKTDLRQETLLRNLFLVPTELWSFINQRHMPNWKWLVTLGSTSHPLDALLTFLPGLGRCSLHQPDPHTSWVQLQPDWRREGPVGGKLCESGRH